MHNNEKESPRDQEEVQKRYQIELDRYQKQIERRKKILTNAPRE